MSPLEVWVDAKHVGQVKTGGGPLTMAVSPGTHRLQLEITPPRQRAKAAAVDFQVQGGATVAAEVTFSKMTGKIAIQFS